MYLQIKEELNLVPLFLYLFMLLFLQINYRLFFTNYFHFYDIPNILIASSKHSSSNISGHTTI